eukprot:Rmarinus@m.12532
MEGGQMCPMCALPFDFFDQGNRQESFARWDGVFGPNLMLQQVTSEGLDGASSHREDIDRCLRGMQFWPLVHRVYACGSSSEKHYYSKFRSKRTSRLCEFLFTDAAAGAKQHSEEILAALRLYPCSPLLHVALAVNLLRGGEWYDCKCKTGTVVPEGMCKYDAALVCLSRALDLRPRFVTATLLRGIVLFRKGLVCPAIQCFVEVFRVHGTAAVADTYLEAAIVAASCRFPPGSVSVSFLTQRPSPGVTPKQTLRCARAVCELIRAHSVSTAEASHRQQFDVPLLTLARIGATVDMTCSICFNEIELPASTLCGHSYCRWCLLKMLRSSRSVESKCPLCRRVLSTVRSVTTRASIPGSACGDSPTRLDVFPCVSLNQTLLMARMARQATPIHPSDGRDAPAEHGVPNTITLPSSGGLVALCSPTKDASSGSVPIARTAATEDAARRSRASPITNGSVPASQAKKKRVFRGLPVLRRCTRSSSTSSNSSVGSSSTSSGQTERWASVPSNQQACPRAQSPSSVMEAIRKSRDASLRSRLPVPRIRSTL